MADRRVEPVVSKVDLPSGMIGPAPVSLEVRSFAVAAIALARPLRSADRPTRLKVGVAAVVALALLATLWGLYLIPAVTAWLAILMWRR